MDFGKFFFPFLLVLFLLISLLIFPFSIVVCGIDSKIISNKEGYLFVNLYQQFDFNVNI
jgi:hypothetical protein